MRPLDTEPEQHDHHSTNIRSTDGLIHLHPVSTSYIVHDVSQESAVLNKRKPTEGTITSTFSGELYNRKINNTL